MEHPLSKRGLETEDGDEELGEGRGIKLPSLLPALGYLLPPVMALALLVGAWQLWTGIAHVRPYIVPSPLDVGGRLVEDFGYFARNGAITLFEATAGFFLGTVVAISAATVMAHSRFLERSLYPLAVLVKVTPIVAVAPLLLIWFGLGVLPKVLIAALITFFPVMVNALAGLRSVNPGALDFFRSVHASRKEVFFKLRVPSSLPYLLAAFRIAIPLSVIGAVVGEYVSGDRGLGSVIIVAHYNVDMPTLFAAILVLAFMGIGLTILTSYIERRVLFWHDSFISP